MRRSSTWILAIAVLTATALIVACSTKYSSSSNGLIVVPVQGGQGGIQNQNAPIMQSFSLDLGNGHVSQINNVNGPPTAGLPTSVVLDPAGAFAYVIVLQNAAVPGSVTGIQAFSIASDGKLGSGTTPVSEPNPVALAIDSAGKFLFVANATANGAAGSVDVFSIGSGGSLTLAGSTTLPLQTGGGTPSPSALAVTRTVYPTQFAVCSNGQTPPSSENLYVADVNNDVLLNYSVSSAGALTLLPTATGNGVITGASPAGVAVDPCNRFAFVTNATSNNVSAYTICNLPSATSGNCTSVDFHLQEAPLSPYSAGDVPGPIAVDPYGSFVYAVDTGSNQVSAYRISASTGSLTAEGTSATNVGPNSIAIRGDDTWVFVANTTSANLSQYAITPATGALNPITTPVNTLNLPSGVAVK